MSSLRVMRLSAFTDLMPVKLPIDIRGFGIGNLAPDITNDIAVFESGRMRIAKNDVPARIMPPGKTVAPVIGAAQIRWTGAVIRSFTGMDPLLRKNHESRGMHCLRNFKRRFRHIRRSGEVIVYPLVHPVIKRGSWSDTRLNPRHGIGVRGEWWVWRRRWDRCKWTGNR